jgi:hypothetical protein
MHRNIRWDEKRWRLISETYFGSHRSYCSVLYQIIMHFRAQNYFQNYPDGGNYFITHTMIIRVGHVDSSDQTFHG